MPSGAKRTRTSCATTYNGLRSICRVYDAFNEDADYDALFRYVCGVLRAHGVEDGIVADLGCGTGELTLRLRPRDMI